MDEKMSTEIVTIEEHLQRFINQIAVEQKFESFDTKITPVSSGGANYTSNLFKIKITHNGRDDLNLFAKVAALNEIVRNQVIFQPFDNERLFYTDLMKTYRQIEEKHGVSEKDRMKFCGYYGAEETHGREILVLEDLTSQGFGSANRFQSVDWSYAAAAITKLAKFHALSITFKHERPSEFKKLTAHFRSGFFEKGEYFDVMFNGAISSALSAVRKENKEKLDNFFRKQDTVLYFNDLFKPLRCNVILHADFRADNMVHKVINDGTTEVILLDYQTIQVGSPIVDLLYFIFTATDGPFRAIYYKKLLNHYYAELSTALARFGLNVENVYSKKNFEYELTEKLPFGLLTTVLTLPALTMPELTMPEDQAPALGDDFSTLTLQPTGELYSRRLNEVVDEYITAGVLV